MAAAPPIKLYTNHNCPWAHRAHIALSELGLPFEEEIIDLAVPRTPEYLKINPRGLVPSLAYGDDIIIESAIVSQFLADSVPSTHLTPRTGDPKAALARERIAFFVDTFFSKVNSNYYASISAKTAEDADKAGKLYAAAVVKEIEPLLKDAKPFFGGSDKLTMAEVLTGSFVLRVFTLTGVEDAPLPASLLEGLETAAPNFYAWGTAVSKHPSVTGIYDTERVAGHTRARRDKARASI